MKLDHKNAVNNDADKHLVSDILVRAVKTGFFVPPVTGLVKPVYRIVTS